MQEEKNKLNGEENNLGAEVDVTVESVEISDGGNEVVVEEITIEENSKIVEEEGGQEENAGSETDLVDFLEEMDESEQDEADKIAVIEATVFMYGEPVSFSRLAEILQVDEERARVLTEKLKEIYDERKICGLRILIDEEKVQLVTHPNCAEVIDDFVKSELNKPLSQSALEVLGIIAYRGPISKADIEAIRGVNCAFTLRNLLTRDLIEKVADENNARISLFKTTFKFLRTLGIESESELPDFEKLLNDKRIDAILYSDSDLVQR